MTIAIERVIRQFWMPGINAVTGKKVQGLQAYLADDRYRIYTAPSTTQFTVTPFDAGELKGAICCDLARMASASFESIHNIVPVDPADKSCAWSAIRSYYAAFFSAHAIMRIFGKSCAQLDTAHVNYIGKVAGYIYPNSIIPSSGLYVANWDENNKTLNFSFIGGSHETIWKEFKITLEYLRNTLLSPNAIGLITELQSSSNEIDKLKADISSDGQNNGNWLSMIRNRVNYRHDFAIWYPYGNSMPYYNAIWSSGNDRWLKAPLPTKAIPTVGREIEKLIEVSGAIVAMCRGLIEQIDETCAGGRSFVRYGPKTYIDKAKAI